MVHVTRDWNGKFTAQNKNGQEKRDTKEGFTHLQEGHLPTTHIQSEWISQKLIRPKHDNQQKKSDNNKKNH